MMLCPHCGGHDVMAASWWPINDAVWVSSKPEVIGHRAMHEVSAMRRRGPGRWMAELCEPVSDAVDEQLDIRLRNGVQISRLTFCPDCNSYGFDPIDEHEYRAIVDGAA